MNVFRSISRIFSNPLPRLRAERDAADLALRIAILRGDTRGIHAARKVMARATHNVMREEVARGFVASLGAPKGPAKLPGKVKA